MLCQSRDYALRLRAIARDTSQSFEPGAATPRQTPVMGITVYVADPDPEERRWVEAVLAPGAGRVQAFEDTRSLLALLSGHEDACLIAAVEPDEAVIVEFVRTLRDSGIQLPVIALGPATAFRTAVALARLEGTDFLERPVSSANLCAAVYRLTGAAV